MTTQVRDRILINGWGYWLMRRLDIDPDHDCIQQGQSSTTMSSNWEGYTATWSVRDGRLYLANLSGRYILASDAPVPATWISTDVIVVFGGDLPPIMHPRPPDDESWRVLRVDQGQIISDQFVEGSPWSLEIGSTPPVELHPYGLYMPPLADKIIVGSFPSETLTNPFLLTEFDPEADVDFYYGTGDKGLWPLISKMIGQPIETLDDMIGVLVGYGVGLGDVISRCRRGKNLNDERDFFEDIQANEDLKVFLKNEPKAEVVFFDDKS